MDDEFAEYQRVRTKGPLTLLWDASENIRTTLDYTWSAIEVERTYNNYSARYNVGGQETLWTDESNASHLIYTESPISR